MKTLRKSVRDILYDPFLQFGYTKMHCSSVKKEDDVYVIHSDRIEKLFGKKFKFIFIHKIHYVQVKTLNLFFSRLYILIDKI